MILIIFIIIKDLTLSMEGHFIPTKGGKVTEVSRILIILNRRMVEKPLIFQNV